MTQAPYVNPAIVRPLPPQGKTRLVLPGDMQVLSGIQETDVRTALTRGIKEYIEQLDITFVGGTYSRFQKVFQTWSEPEDPAQYPGACVYSTMPGDFDASAFSPRLAAASTLGPNQYLRKSSEYVLELIVDVYATSPQERMALSVLLERAFNPTDDMYGFWLELPHYFNARATFSLETSEYVDDIANAQARRRRVLLGLTATVPVLHLVGEVRPLQVQTDILTNTDPITEG